MNIFVLVVLGLVCTTQAYVYVQVQKGDKKDTSNVDALIHKEVPSDSVDHITDQLKNTFREGKMHKYKRFEIRKRADEKTASQDKQATKNTWERKSASTSRIPTDIDSVVLAVDTGAKTETASKTGFDLVDKLLSAVKEFGKEVSKGKGSSSPLLRAQEKYNIQPEVVHFRSGKPTLKFELNSDSILKMARELLSSPKVRRYADEIAQKAAVIFKVIKEELNKN